MAYILRVIRKARWYRDENAAWLGEGDFQADALSDLETKGNALSLWFVADDRSNLEQVVSALASTRQHISNLDYALVDQRFISENNLKLQTVISNSPYEKANTWHRDLVELSASQLCALAKIIFEHGEKKRCTEKEILKLMARAIANGHIDRAKLIMSHDETRRIDQYIAEIGPA